VVPLAYLKDSDIDVNTSVPLSSFKASSSIVDYPTFVTRTPNFVNDPESAEAIYSGDYSESNLFESVKPVFQGPSLQNPSAPQRFRRVILLVKQDHEIPAFNAKGLSSGLNNNDTQAIKIVYNGNLNDRPFEVVEINTGGNSKRFTILLRSIPNSDIRVNYSSGDQAAFVSEDGVVDEANGTQSEKPATFIRDSGDDGDNVASVAVASGGSGYDDNNGGGITQLNVATTGGTGTGLLLHTTVSPGGAITNAVIADQGEGYTNGDEVLVTGLENTTNAVITVTTGPRDGQKVNVTVTDGEVTAMTIHTAGSNYQSGDLMKVVLDNGATVKYRYVDGDAIYSGFTGILPITIETHGANSLSVGDVVVFENDNPTANLFKSVNQPTHPTFPGMSLTRGIYQWVDKNALFFLYQNLTVAQFNSITAGNSSTVDIISGSATLPNNSDKINPSSIPITGSYNTIGQRVNPTFKAVKITCPSAWRIKESGSSTATDVAANAEHIFRYFGANDGFFQAQTQGGGSATLTLQYFEG